MPSVHAKPTEFFHSAIAPTTHSTSTTALSPQTFCDAKPVSEVEAICDNNLASVPAAEELIACLHRRLPELVEIARRKGCDHDEAQDAAHKAIMRGKKAIDTGEVERIRDRKAWLRKLASNFAYTTLRKKRPWVSIEGLPLAAPSDTGSNHRLGDVIRQAVADLPELHRQIIEMRYFQGLTQDRVAAAVGLPKTRVRQREFAALSRLRTMLADDFS